MIAQNFLPAWLYSDQQIFKFELNKYSKNYWHPLMFVQEIKAGEIIEKKFLNQSLFISSSTDKLIRVFKNRCPHRGSELLLPKSKGNPSSSIFCKYHGWTFDDFGRLKTLPLKDDFEPKIELSDFCLEKVKSLVNGPLIWINFGDKPLPINDQIRLILEKCEYEWNTSYRIFTESIKVFNCNWKIAHDNTLDDYHVAVAHKNTLHKEQGPIKNYQYSFSKFCNLLTTPMKKNRNLYTFGLLPWTHIIVWPKRGLVLISYLPISIDKCNLEIKLASESLSGNELETWKRSILKFLKEDKVIVESVQKSYKEDFKMGPPNRLEQRIIHWQEIYREYLNSSGIYF